MTSTGNGQLTPSTSSCDEFLEVPSTRCAPYFPLFWAYLTLPSTTLTGRYRFMGHRRQRDGPGTGFRKDPKQGQVLPLSLTLALSLALYLALTYPSVGLTA